MLFLKQGFLVTLVRICINLLHLINIIVVHVMSMRRFLAVCHLKELRHPMLLVSNFLPYPFVLPMIAVTDGPSVVLELDNLFV